MTIHYHGADINPARILETLAGKFFCVSYAYPRQTKRCHEIGQGVMLDNGAFSTWRQGLEFDAHGYYDWASEWLDCPTTWGVIPDIIAGNEHDNKILADACPFPKHKMAPVWHLHESLDYLNYLVNTWPRVCLGSSGDYSVVGDEAWMNRITEAFDTIWDRKPMIHMLRGMKCSTMNFPFASLNSADIARNHHAARRGDHQALDMANRWDSLQCPTTWKIHPREQPWIV